VAALTDAASSAAIVVGAPVAKPTGGATNAALVITSEGVIHRQDKIYLPNYNRYDEGDRFEEGSTLNLVDIAGFSIGIIICEDAWHPSLAFLARLKGADVLIHPAASAEGAIGDGFSSAEGWATINRAEALYHAVYVVFANMAGADGIGHFWGGSTIFSPLGGVLVRAEGDPTLISSQFSGDELCRARQTLPMTDLEDIGLAARLLDEVREAPEVAAASEGAS
jgi:predicted amidohydrolase